VANMKEGRRAQSDDWRPHIRVGNHLDPEDICNRSPTNVECVPSFKKVRPGLVIDCTSMR
jgi:hypothetical protein